MWWRSCSCYYICWPNSYKLYFSFGVRNYCGEASLLGVSCLVAAGSIGSTILDRFFSFSFSFVLSGPSARTRHCFYLEGLRGGGEDQVFMRTGFDPTSEGRYRRGSAFFFLRLLT